MFNREWVSWIDPDGADPALAAQVVFRCPTGALRAESPAGADLEPPQAANLVQVVRDGPLYLRGELRISSVEGEILHRDTRMALCRCGASRNKPFCDNSHLRTGFSSGPPKSGAQESGAAGGSLTITPKRDGPYELAGNLEIRDGAQLLFRGNSTRLCRCGASKEMPFCDDSHHEFEFEADPW